MKTVHIILTAAVLVGCAVGLFLFHDETALFALVFTLACMMLQMAYILRGEKQSRFLPAKLRTVGIALLLCQAACCCVTVFFAPWAVYICALLLGLHIPLLLSRSIRRDPDPTGELFVSRLTESMEIISRATAERECGIDTQMLYELSRFCEPCSEPSARETEQRILTEIKAMRPDDTDEDITLRCREISALLRSRERILTKN